MKIATMTIVFTTEIHDDDDLSDISMEQARKETQEMLDIEGVHVYPGGDTKYIVTNIKVT